MANLLWGLVYFHDKLAGVLREEPGNRISFTYDTQYLNTNPAIAYTLPLRQEPYISHESLPSFFDNLVAEGWLEQAQMRLLGKRSVSRFELLLAFGLDCAGAVSIHDPRPVPLTEALLDQHDPKEIAMLTARASLSGVQPKLMLIEKNGVLHPARINELSTHIAKFPSPGHEDILFNEFLTMLAFKALVGEDEIADLALREIKDFNELALVIKRFDRVDNQRKHFEEFNQLLDKRSQDKYTGAYKDMAQFMSFNTICLKTDIYRLFLRILAGILLGNTDMHFKNFAMFHTPAGLRLTPSYDQVAAALYDYKTLALAIGGATNLPINNLKPKNIMKLGEEFGLNKQSILMAIKHLEKNKMHVQETVYNAKHGSLELKDNLIQFMEKRWNGTFALIG